MIKKKKSGVWTFLFSLVPGAAEMYMGFMNMGVSLLAVFMITIALTALLEIGALAFIPVIVWFYGFFHARNMAGMSEEQLQQVEDKYLFVNGDIDAMEIGKKYRKLIAVILILVGVMGLWNSLYHTAINYVPAAYQEYVWAIGDIVPKVVIAIIIIFIGIKMIAGKKEELEDDK